MIVSARFCDLCQQRADAAFSFAESAFAFGNSGAHVCENCASRPISDLIEALKAATSDATKRHRAAFKATLKYGDDALKDPQ